MWRRIYIFAAEINKEPREQDARNRETHRPPYAGATQTIDAVASPESIVLLSAFPFFSPFPSRFPLFIFRFFRVSRSFSFPYLFLPGDVFHSRLWGIFFVPYRI